MFFNKLRYGVFKRQGINNNGRITIYNRGGGLKKKLFLIDFKRNLIGIPAKIVDIYVNKINTSFIGLIYYTCGIFSYILLTEGLKIGDKVITYDGLEYGLNIKKVGSVYQLKYLKIGQFVHSIEQNVGKGAIYVRSAGNSAKLFRKSSDIIVIRLHSGIYRLFDNCCSCVIGQVSNSTGRTIEYGKAGIKRLLGWRPKVRGVAMNPIDHPHGGGQGKTKGGRCSVTPWGVLTRGKKTRKVRKMNKLIVNEKYIK